MQLDFGKETAVVLLQCLLREEEAITSAGIAKTSIGIITINAIRRFSKRVICQLANEIIQDSMESELPPEIP